MSPPTEEQRVAEMVDRLCNEVRAEMHRTEGPWAIVGIRRRGDVLAKRLAKVLEPDFEGSVDITLYRDDLSEVGPQPVVRTTEINFDVDGANILLVDDVLMSGRSVRAAIQSLIDFGRPRCIRLLVLVDRGGRELPIRPDYVGLRVATDDSQHIRVRLRPTDEKDAIIVLPSHKSKQGSAS
jgi:pyrimidine operon attenuation protein/uracil phosphoribosyltransferase